MLTLVIGNKNYSSWSLRPWLLLSAHGIPFEEVRIPLDTPSTQQQIRSWSAAGKVPVLRDEELCVWDSLAICEYVSEQYLEGRGWPASPEARALARACSAEMHAGFPALREQMPMNCRAVNRRVPQTPALQADIARIEQLWSAMRERFGDDGHWLCGGFSIADCLFAPVAFRFRSYGVNPAGLAGAYLQQLLGHPQMQAWLQQAEAEQEVLEHSEFGR